MLHFKILYYQVALQPGPIGCLPVPKYLQSKSKQFKTTVAGRQTGAEMTLSLHSPNRQRDSATRVRAK